MLATIGSITTAARFAKMIERNTGGRAEVVHTPAAINHGGCSYSVRFKDNSSSAVRRIERENGVRVKRYYRERGKGSERLYDAIP